MRDLLVTLIVFGAIPFILMRPAVGVMMWNWLAYMNPHRLAYGFAHAFPFAQITAVATLLAFFMTADRKKFPWMPVTVLWVLFILWMNVTTLFALVPDQAILGWERDMKIQLFALFTLMVITSQLRLNALIWVIALSLGFFGIKGGIFTLVTGGGSRVWGPPGSFIEDNNALALALLMILPLLRYLQTTVTRRILRIGLGVAMGLVAASVLASYSRGAFLGAIAMGGILWLKSRHKVATGLGLVLVIPIVFFLMPDQWFDRMNTISDYQHDGSAQERINVWWFSFNLAVDHPIFGGGFNTFTPQLFLKYAPNQLLVVDAHSIYFQILAEHGFVGLMLFLLLGFNAFRTASWILRNTKGRMELAWARTLAGMLQLSLTGYAVAGAFLSLAYFDLFYSVIGLLVVTRVLVQKTLAGEEKSRVSMHYGRVSKGRRLPMIPVAAHTRINPDPS